MHVMLLCNEMRLGGAERYTIDLANSLIERGVTVTMSYDGPVTHVPGPLPQVRRFEPGRSSQRGLGLRRLYVDREVGKRVARYVRDEKVDVINTVMLDTGIWAWLAGRLHHVPVFHTPMGVVPTLARLEKAMVSTRSGRGFIRAMRVWFIAISRYYGWELVNRTRIPESVIRYANLGTNLRAFQPRPANPELRAALGLSDGPVLGIIARLDAVKGHHKLMAAMPAIVRECPNAQWLLVGDGPQRTVLEAQAESLGVRDRCIFTGWRTDTSDLMALCDVYVQTTDGPNLGLSALQALAQGRALAVFAADPLEERMAADTVVEGVNGHTVPTGHPEQAGQTIGRLLADRERFERMGQASRRLAEEQYDWELHTARVLDIYAERLNGATVKAASASS